MEMKICTEDRTKWDLIAINDNLADCLTVNGYTRRMDYAMQFNDTSKTQ